MRVRAHVVITRARVREGARVRACRAGLKQNGCTRRRKGSLRVPSGISHQSEQRTAAGARASCCTGRRGCRGPNSMRRANESRPRGGTRDAPPSPHPCLPESAQRRECVRRARRAQRAHHAPPLWPASSSTPRSPAPSSSAARST
eukprot:2687327-Pleurochrysis_carterae.AAC.3